MAAGVTRAGGTAAPNPTPALLERILQSLVAELPTDWAGICACVDDLNHLELLAVHSNRALDDERAGTLQALLEAECAAPDEGLRILPSNVLAGTGFRSGVTLRLTLSGEPVGLIGLFSRRASAYTPDNLTSIGDSVALIRALLENRRLKENEAIARAIRHAAQLVGENPSAQDMVNVLRDHLFSPHVTTCVALFYGPLREDRPNGPFAYLEVQGSWLKRRGAGVGFGVRVYLDNYADFLHELDERKMLVIPDSRTIADRLDPFVRGFMRSERMRSLVLIALEAGGRRLGVILIAADHRYEFSAQELRSYHIVAEFLAMTAMANVLQQQHDFVQRGRAAVLDAVTDGVLMVLPTDPMAAPDEARARVLAVNLAFGRMFKIAPERAQGLSITNLLTRMQIPRDVAEGLRRDWLSVSVRDPSTQQGGFDMMHPQGFPTSIEWYSAPVYQNNHIFGRIYLFHDSSARRTAAALRETFLSRMSHELRTPLTSIKGFAEFILEACKDNLPDLAREYTEIILKSAHHLNAVFTDIIEIDRANTGNLKLTISTAHLPDLIINAVASMEMQYRTKNQQIVIDLNDDLPPVQVDVIRITQVLNNLLSNAIKFAPPDSAIHIDMTYVDSGVDLPASAPPDVVTPALLVIVTNGGKGLTPEEAERVFLPFFQTRDAQAARQEGTGLGLTIARSFVELHRGKIWAEPRQAGQWGARFLFTLPTAES